jgi:replication factor C small subunit
MSYKCTICGEPFKKERFMKSHRTLKHSDDESPSVNDKEYRECSECGHYFEAGRGFFVHVSNEHPDTSLYEEICEWMSGENNPMYGEEFSEEHIQKILNNRTHFWNKEGNEGRKEELKKEFSDRVKQQYNNGDHITQREDFTEKVIEPRGEEWRKKISETMKNKPDEEYPFKNPEIRKKAFKNLPKRQFVEETGHKVASSWEKEIDIRLDSLDIDYNYEPEFELKDSVYHPDFQIDEYIVEVKGWDTEHSHKRAEKFLKNYSNYTYIVVGTKLPCDIHIPWEDRDRLEAIIQ